MFYTNITPWVLGGGGHESNLPLVRFEVFDGGDYEECPLLGYKNPVRTSQETHYVSATELSRLFLCKI
jgi:hypothetical protein